MKTVLDKALPPSMERPLLVAALSLVLCANEEYAIRALVSQL